MLRPYGKNVTGMPTFGVFVLDGSDLEGGQISDVDERHGPVGDLGEHLLAQDLDQEGQRARRRHLRLEDRA